MPRPEGYGTKVELTCQECGKKWQVSFGLRHRKFCSNSCRGKADYRNKKKIGKEPKLPSKKGKTHFELYGAEKAHKISKILSKSKKGNKNPAKRPEVKQKISEAFQRKVAKGWESPLKGITFSEERKAEISRITKIAMSRPDVKEKMSQIYKDNSLKMKKFHKENKEKVRKYLNKPETKEKMRASHIKAIQEGKYAKFKETNIEIFVEKLLNNCNFKLNKDYFKQYPFPESNPKYLLDFYMPEHNLAIEAMGCYWHKCFKCGHGQGREADKKRVKFLNKNGVNLLNLWEHDMKSYTAADFKLFFYGGLKGFNVY
jgi:very-short-patch-repair endonuclease